MKTFSLAAALAVAAALPATAQEPEKVAPDVVSLPGRHETFPAIDPVDGSLWFSVYDQNFDKQTVMRAARVGASWSAAVKAAFSGEFGDRAPRFSPDGKRLYFTSNRPAPGAKPGDLNIWVVERQGSEWSAPSLVPAPVSVAESRDMHNVALTDGTVFLSSYRPGGAGRADIWRVPPNGEPTNLGAPINDALGQTDLYVSPDGKWMILVVTEPPNGLGGDDLLVSEFINGTWSAPRLLPAPINSAEYEYGPSMSPDGKWLYFTSHRTGGNADVYRIPIERLGLKKQGAEG